MVGMQVSTPHRPDWDDTGRIKSQINFPRLAAVRHAL